jgi:hypothetical protein
MQESASASKAAASIRRASSRTNDDASVGLRGGGLPGERAPDDSGQGPAYEDREEEEPAEEEVRPDAQQDDPVFQATNEASEQTIQRYGDSACGGPMRILERMNSCDVRGRWRVCGHDVTAWLCPELWDRVKPTAPGVLARPAPAAATAVTAGPPGTACLPRGPDFTHIQPEVQPARAPVRPTRHLPLWSAQPVFVSAALFSRFTQSLRPASRAAWLPGMSASTGRLPRIPRWWRAPRP